MNASLLAHVLLLVPPAVTRTDSVAAAQEAIDPARMKTVLSKLASDELAGRRTGTPGITAARDILVAELEASKVPPPAAGYVLKSALLENVAAILPGTDPTGEVVVLGAHYYFRRR